MAQIFENPLPQFFSSTPTAYSGGILRFYITGTSTPLAVYSDSALSVSLGTSVTLNSAGRADSVIYLQDAAYKVVLEYPSGTVIWTADPVRGRDSSLIVKTSTGSGSPNGVVAGTAGSAGILPDFFWDFTNAILYVATTTGSASTTVWTAINASSPTNTVTPPQGRLTLTSATPVLASDVAAATSVYYTPYVGNLVPLYNGTSMVPTSFAELTLALASQHSASGLYDVFMFSNSGVATLATGPIWSTVTAGSCARGTGAGTTQLSRVAGYWVNTVAMTGRNGATTYAITANRATYLGTIFIDGSAGQVSCLIAYGQSRKWGVWNAYNRVPIFLKAGDTTASWTYATNTVRAANASSANSLTILSGLAEEQYDLRYVQRIALNSAGASVEGSIGVGFNSTTTYSGLSGDHLMNTGGGVVAQPRLTVPSQFIAVPSIGINVITALENSPAGTTTFTGNEASMVLSATWRG